MSTTSPDIITVPSEQLEEIVGEKMDIIIQKLGEPATKTNERTIQYAPTILPGNSGPLGEHIEFIGETLGITPQTAERWKAVFNLTINVGADVVRINNATPSLTSKAQHEYRKIFQALKEAGIRYAFEIHHYVHNSYANALGGVNRTQAPDEVRRQIAWMAGPDAESSECHVYDLNRMSF